MSDEQPSWRMSDGTSVACREKIKTLQANHEEARQVLQDAFEDAILMGVDEAMMRRALAGLVNELKSPKRPE